MGRRIVRARPAVALGPVAGGPVPAHGKRLEQGLRLTAHVQKTRTLRRAAVRARCNDLTAHAVKALSEQLGTEPLTASDDEFIQMATVRLPPCNAEELCLRLYHERRIEVLAQTWRGEPTLRVSFQGYNDENDLDALLTALPELL